VGDHPAKGKPCPTAASCTAWACHPPPSEEGLADWHVKEHRKTSRYAAPTVNEMSTYLGLVHKDTDSDYGVSFPDLPGCASSGRTLDEAMAMAKEALAFHVEGLLEDDDVLPEPTVADKIDRDDAVLMIAIEVADNLRVERVNVTIPAITLQRMDSFAERQGLTRSALFIEAVNRWIAQEPQRPGLLPVYGVRGWAMHSGSFREAALSSFREVPASSHVSAMDTFASRSSHDHRDIAEAALAAIHHALEIPDNVIPGAELRSIMARAVIAPKASSEKDDLADMLAALVKAIANPDAPDDHHNKPSSRTKNPKR
jgi:predicted RNase H-like HicB family nuclease